MAQRLKPAKQRQQTAAITLQGSVQIVTEFFEYGLSSILYQRNLYPADDFKTVKKYGLNMLIPADDSLRSYLSKITGQLADWLSKRVVSRLVLAIIDKESRETVERWQFDINLDDASTSNEPTGKENEAPEAKQAKRASKPMSEVEVRNQIQQVIKHICASNTFLPILEIPSNYTFNVLAYTNIDSEVPSTWSDSDAHLIRPGVGGGNVEHVKLRSFTTSVHRVEGLVAYRLGDDI